LGLNNKFKIVIVNI